MILFEYIEFPLVLSRELLLYDFFALMHLSVETDTPPPDPGQIGGFDKGPDQIIPKAPAPRENHFEIKFPSPW